MSTHVTVYPERIRALTHAADGPVQRRILQLANRVLNTARRNVNVDTGYLRSTGHLEGPDSNGVCLVVFDADYAIYVHNGNGYYPGNPFLLDALTSELGRGL